MYDRAKSRESREGESRGFANNNAHPNKVDLIVVVGVEQFSGFYPNMIRQLNWDQWMIYPQELELICDKMP